MANYFPVALTGTTRSCLMNLPEWTLHSWSELCRQFTANFEITYARPGNETDLHTIQQRPGESLSSFIQRISQVRNTIPRISNASVVVAFHQGVRDEKMLEKLTTHDIQDVPTLLSLSD
jgi:broad specificity phosphatase PhoE